MKHLIHKKIIRHKTLVFHDVTRPKQTGVIFETDPKTRSAPAGANVSYRGALQNVEQFHEARPSVDTPPMMYYTTDGCT